MKAGRARFTVALKSAGDPDHYQYFESGVLSPTVHKSCASIHECQRAVREYATEHFLSAGNWTGGEVREDGRIVGRISYNGRFWPLERKNAGSADNLAA